MTARGPVTTLSTNRLTEFREGFLFFVSVQSRTISVSATINRSNKLNEGTALHVS